MTDSERMMMLLKADKSTLAKIDAILLGRDSERSASPCLPLQDITTYTFTDAAKKLGIGRKTLYRMVEEEHRIPVIRFRRTRRISHDAIVAFLRSQAAYVEQAGSGKSVS